MPPTIGTFNVATLAGVLLFSCVANPQDSPSATQIPAFGLRVEVKTVKQTYTVGEGIRFTVTLRNGGRKAVYISKSFSDAGGGVAGFYITIKQLSGKRPSHCPGFAFDAMSGKERTPEQILREDYLLLPPSAFVGFETEAHDCLVKHPGTYEVTAEYSAQDMNVNTVRLVAEKSGEVVTGSVHSPPSKFRVREFTPNAPAERNRVSSHHAMSTKVFTESATSDASFSIADAARLLTPALLIDRDRVRHNIATTLDLLGGDPNRWRPHVKTAKLGQVMRMLVEAGVRQVKCATSLELSVACQAGVDDALIAYPLVGANAGRVRQIAVENPKVTVSVLVENESQFAQWRQSPVGLFIDVNPGMNRTGVPEARTGTILELCQSIVSSGLPFRGLHYYDGHLSKYGLAERCPQAEIGYHRLMDIVDALRTSGIPVPEVITAGTPAFPCSLSFRPFSNAPFLHRVSPGTFVYCDSTALAQLPPEYGYVPAAVVMTRVVSHPAPGLITCDAGHKSVSADAGVPTCVVLGHPELEPLTPSEEHLPMRVKEGAPIPAIGELLYLVPRHVCPTVNNFDHAVIIADGRVISVEPVSARGREHPLAGSQV